jgi:hypothetical protein
MVRNDTKIPHPSPLLIKEREKEKTLLTLSLKERVPFGEAVPEG